MGKASSGELVQGTLPLLILRTLAVHGLNVNDGIEDRDEMGICVEPLEEAPALWAPFEQFINRTAAEREGRDDARPWRLRSTAESLLERLDTDVDEDAEGGAWATNVDRLITGSTAARPTRSAEPRSVVR